MSSGSAFISALISFLLPECAANRLTESMMPSAADITITDVPPFDMNGSGCHTGKTPVTIAMWTRAWKTIMTAHPMMRNAGKAREHM